MIHSEQTKYSLRKGDQVQVIAGRDKGKTGKVLKVDSKAGRVTVEKINVVKKHVKPTQKQAGGIVEKEIPLHYSNVLLFCVKCDRGVRHARKLLEGNAKKTAKGDKASSAAGKSRSAKVRVCKRCNESLDLA